MMNLRPAQEAILEYDGGYMAISAVPGSGKTFTLSLLAAQLIDDGRINPEQQQILIVTYLNSSVDAFKARIRQRLEERELPPLGFDVRTLHSLALEIVRVAYGGLGPAADALNVLDDVQRGHYLSTAVSQWIDDHPEQWLAFLDDRSPQMRARWQSITERTARVFIRAAKNERYHPDQILARLAEAEAADGFEAPLLRMLTAIYGRYQTILNRQAAFDFDDLIWRAVDLLQERPHLADELRDRWPYVLEDEAQDSVPLQEVLLETLTGDPAAGGNWVRVGDPNQAITSTFTAAHPRYFNAFLDRDGVTTRPLPNSGRSAPLIFQAANTLLHWVLDNHPAPEVQAHTFRRQDILPTPPGDAQPNPPDAEAGMRIKVYKHREEEELPGVARLAARYTRERPSHTLAILVPTNQVGFTLAEFLDDLEVDYDNLLRGSGQEREIAAAMHAVLALLADPLRTSALVDAHASLRELEHPATAVPLDDEDHFHALLRSVHRPEQLLFAGDDHGRLAALPAGVAGDAEEEAALRLAQFLGGLFPLRQLPIDDLALALGDELFAWGEVHESDLAIAYQIAAIMRRWRDAEPDWRLPELAGELSDVAAGRRSLPLTRNADLGYEPEPGRITLATQHSAKGLEWDAVFLVGVDGFWIPGALDAPFLGAYDFLGGDPTAEATAQLRYLMQGEAGVYPGRTATESAHIDVISERLRLLYVGVTRARRYLHLSRSRATRQYNKERPAEPATVLGVLYRYLKERRAS